jgi:phospholipid/cholesterol/gamma-HCH transport system substrate-binding protein
MFDEVNMEYRKNEVRAGIFLLAALAIFVVMVFAVSDVLSLFKAKKELKVYFAFSDGIEKNAQVRLSGIKIGKVTGIRVAPEQGDQVEVTLSILEDTVIREDSRAAIKTLGLVGGKYVELTPGSPDAKPLKAGETIEGEQSLKMEDLTKAGLDVVAKLTNIARNLDRIVGDPALARNIKGTVQNVEQVTEHLREITASLDENKANVTETIKSLPELMTKLDATIANLKEISSKTDSTMADNRKQIDAAMENFKEVSQNVKEFTEEVKKHPWKLLRKP